MYFLILVSTVVYLFILYTVKADRGSKEPTRALFGAAGFGLLAVIIAGFLNELLIPSQALEAIGTEQSHTLPFGLLAQSVLTVGLIEEGLKAIPLALFIYRKGYFNELTDGVIYFGIAGLTFGIIEDLTYTAEYGVGVGIFRIIFSPYLHAGFTVLFGIALVQMKLLKKPFLFVVGGFGAAILAHALYDFAVFKGGFFLLLALALTVLLNTMIFVFFKKAQKIDEARGMSAVGINKYCRNCGVPNPKHYLFCEQCGKHT